MILFWILGEKKFIEIIGEEKFDQLNEDYRLVNNIKDTNKKFKPAIKK